MRNAEQIAQRGLAVKVFGGVQFARRLAQSGDDQIQRGQRPRNLLAARRHCAREKLVQPKLLDEFPWLLPQLHPMLFPQL